MAARKLLKNSMLLAYLASCQAADANKPDGHAAHSAEAQAQIDELRKQLFGPNEDRLTPEQEEQL
jgi:hypothetical protein